MSIVFIFSRFSADGITSPIGAFPTSYVFYTVLQFYCLSKPEKGCKGKTIRKNSVKGIRAGGAHV